MLHVVGEPEGPFLSHPTDNKAVLYFIGGGRKQWPLPASPRKQQQQQQYCGINESTVAWDRTMVNLTVPC